MKIFIIDDEQVSIFIIKQKLILDGLAEDKDIFAFLSAKEALAALAQFSDVDLPAIILLDLNMPEMDGWMFLDALASLESGFREQCRIYVLTSSLALSDEAKSKRNTMITGYFHKPLSEENIREIIFPKSLSI